MTTRFMPYGLFYSLGALFLIISRNLEATTLLCVFYSFFVGTIWTLIPRLARAETLAWTHLIPPFLLLMLMMLGAKMKMIMATDTVILTAAALIHLRACILAFARMPNQLRLFKWAQFLLFMFILCFIFQDRVVAPTLMLNKTTFIIILITLSLASVGLLVRMDRMQKRIA